MVQYQFPPKAYSVLTSMDTTGSSSGKNIDVKGKHLFYIEKTTPIINNWQGFWGKRIKPDDYPAYFFGDEGGPPSPSKRGPKEKSGHGRDIYFIQERASTAEFEPKWFNNFYRKDDNNDLRNIIKIY